MSTLFSRACLFRHKTVGACNFACLSFPCFAKISMFDFRKKPYKENHSHSLFTQLDSRYLIRDTWFEPGGTRKGAPAVRALPGISNGAHGRNRTGDPILTMDVLCLLSYMGSYLRMKTSKKPYLWSGKRDSNPRPSAWKADALTN